MGTSPTETPATVRSRLGVGWVVSFVGAAVVFASLAVFMLQNTGSAEFSFLWMDGTAPVAVALLIATGGGVLLAQFRSRGRRG